MQHRLSAGAIVEHEGRVLMVRHVMPDQYDFWVAPGGGVQGVEDLGVAAAREVREESGLEVETGRLLYIEELFQPNLRHCKFWFEGRLIGGRLSAAGAEAKAEHIIEASWLSEQDMESKTVFPPVLAAQYWKDRRLGTTGPLHLGLREMKFW